MVVLMLVFFYGQPPGYANSFALSDLPWHQVNPSAFAMPLVIFAWAWHRTSVISGRLGWGLAVAGVALLIAIAVLSHGMSGILGGCGLFLSGVAETERRRARLSAALVSSLAAFGLTTLWPWYDFIKVVYGSPDNWYWFNPGILQLMLLVWCLPAFVVSLAALPLRTNSFIRTCLLGTAGVFLLGLGSYIMRSPSLARLPLAGLIFPQAAVGVFLHRVGVAGWRTWPDRLRRVFDRNRATSSPALVEIVISAMLIGLAIPNIWLILREPHLGRAWIAPLVGAEDKQPHYWQSYHDLLTPHIVPGDVVLADQSTGWPVPSFSGRVVGALHLEYFTKDQHQRVDDVTQFFSADTMPHTRLGILNRYDVKWLLIDRNSMSSALVEYFIVNEAIVAENGTRVLMDATEWQAQRQAVGRTGFDSKGTE